MAEKSPAVLAFLWPVLLISACSGTFPVHVRNARLLRSPTLFVISRIFIMILVACNVYVTLLKFYTLYKNSVASFATLAGDLVLTTANISVYVHLSFKANEIVTTITDMMELEKTFTLKNNIRGRAVSLHSYLVSLELYYFVISVRQHFYIESFNYVESIISYVKELPMMSIELQFIFLTSLVKGFYKDINQELTKERLDEKTLCEIRSYLNALQNTSERLDRDFGLSLLLFLVCLNVYLNCDCFWFVSTLFEGISDNDTVFKMWFLGVSWGGFDLVRVFSYFWVSATTSNEVIYLMRTAQLFIKMFIFINGN
jgi:7tm Chemosensory receptor